MHIINLWRRHIRNSVYTNILEVVIMFYFQCKIYFWKKLPLWKNQKIGKIKRRKNEEWVHFNMFLWHLLVVEKDAWIFLASITMAWACPQHTSSHRSMTWVCPQNTSYQTMHEGYYSHLSSPSSAMTTHCSKRDAKPHPFEVKQWLPIVPKEIPKLHPF